MSPAWATITTDTIGGTTSNTNSFNGYVYASRITASASGLLQTLGINIQYADSGLGHVRLALYSDNGTGTKPSSLLAETASTTLALGWNDPATTTSTSIAVGTYYWIAFQIDDQQIGVYYIAGSFRDYVKSYGAFDATWNTSDDGNTLTINSRMTYESATANPSESLTQSDVLVRNFIGARASTDSGSITDQISKLRNVPNVISDVLAWQDTLTSLFTGSRLLSDQLGLTDVLTWVSPRYVFPSESIQLSELVGTQYGYAKSFIDQILATSTLTSQFIGVRALSDTLTLTDSLSFGGAKTLSDVSSATDTLMRNYVGARVASDLLSIVDSVTRQRMIPRIISDVLSITMSLTHVGPPAAPSSVSATLNPSNPQNIIDLTWTETDTYAGMTYYIEKSIDSSTWVDAGTSSTTTFTASGLSVGVGYYFRIRAYNGQYSAYSSTVLCVTGSTGTAGGPSPTPYYSLVVKVVDLNGSVVQSASVTAGSWSLLSDSTGLANFGALPSGTYTLNIASSGCQVANQTINLNSNHGLTDPLQVSLTCGTQQAATTGTQYTPEQINQLAEGTIGISLLAIATFAIIKSRERKTRKRKESG